MSGTSVQYPEPYVVHPTEAHTHTVILLHGRGSIGEEFATDLFECQVSMAPGNDYEPSINSVPPTKQTFPEHFPGWKWVFPTTKLRYSTTFQEYMYEWFDTASLTYPNEREDLQIEGLAEAVQHVRKIIAAESAALGTTKIVLGGISQGYATALHVLISGNERLGAFVGLSGWMPFAEQIEKAGRGQERATAASAASQSVSETLNLEIVPAKLSGHGLWADTPMFLGHEEKDDVVDCKLGEQARDAVRAVGARPEWHSYDSGEHWVKEPEEVDELVAFLSKQCT